MQSSELYSFEAGFRFEHNLVFAVVNIWYIWNGKRSEPFSVCASNQLTTVDKFGGRPYVDEDAAKKALTDALTKGLSYLSFNSDVFTGKFDDNRYVESLNKRLRAQEYQEELQNEVMEFEDEMQLVIESVEDADSYKRAREHLIPVFLRLKSIAPDLSVQYEKAMVQLKQKYAPAATQAQLSAPETDGAGKKKRASTPVKAEEVTTH